MTIELDALALEQVREQEPRRPRPHDPHLRPLAHLAGCAASREPAHGGLNGTVPRGSSAVAGDPFRGRDPVAPSRYLHPPESFAQSVRAIFFASKGEDLR